MKKEDLKTGMVVENRKKKRYIVFIENNSIISDDEYDKLSYYYEDLRNIKFKQLDIIKVYVTNDDFILDRLYDNEYLQLVWERKEPLQLTDRERAYLKAYSYDYEWVAREEGGGLAVYKEKPKKSERHKFWIGNWYAIKGELFQFIKWEDEEPYRIKDLLGEE